MISREFAERISEKIQSYHDAELTTDEIETLSKIICSEIMLKALGRAFGYCRLVQNEITQLDLSVPGDSTKYTRGQGQMLGIATAVTDLINLITEEEEKDVSP